MILNIEGILAAGSRHPYYSFTLVLLSFIRICARHYQVAHPVAGKPMAMAIVIELRPSKLAAWPANSNVVIGHGADQVSRGVIGRRYMGGAERKLGTSHAVAQAVFSYITERRSEIEFVWGVEYIRMPRRCNELLAAQARRPSTRRCLTVTMAEFQTGNMDVRNAALNRCCAGDLSSRRTPVLEHLLDNEGNTGIMALQAIRRSSENEKAPRLGGFPMITR